MILHHFASLTGTLVIRYYICIYIYNKTFPSVFRDVTEPANIRIRRMRMHPSDADFMYKIRQIRMRIYHAIKITSYYSYCNST